MSHLKLRRGDTRAWLRFLSGVRALVVQYWPGMKQMLLFPDPRPLVERLGADFFRRAPESPGVYLMRDAAETVVYVGKAKNLRKRLASYRVANPERLRRRHLRLLRSVARIELEACADEASALAREAELLLQLRPKFNRAGTWPAQPRFLAWRTSDAGLEMTLTPSALPDWQSQGPLGAGAFYLRASLLRLLWCAFHPEHGIAELPEGWFHNRFPEVAVVPAGNAALPSLETATTLLRNFFAGQSEPLIEWVQRATASQSRPFDAAVREADLETLKQFV